MHRHVRRLNYNFTTMKTKKQLKDITPKAEVSTTAIAKLPAADEAIKHHTEIVRKEEAVLRAEICNRVGNYRERVVQTAKDVVGLANAGREIGLLYKKMLDFLPGKQMTLDFWQQQQALFVDQFGNQISLENLKWFTKIADKYPDSEIKTLNEAMSVRQGMFIDFALE